MKSFVSRLFWTTIILFSLGQTASAQSGGSSESVGFEYNTVMSNYLSARGSDSSLTSLGYGLMGDSYDPDTGSVRFKQVDVSLPGNSSLPVEFTRRTNGASLLPRGYPVSTALGYIWDFDLPYAVSRVDQGKTGNCGSDISNRRAQEQLSIGTKVYLPNIGEETLGKKFDSAPADFQAGTKKHSLAKCRSGGGYIIKDVAGNTYEMGRRTVTSFTQDIPVIGGTSYRAYIDNVYWHVTKVTDVHGNWVKYSYNDYGPTRIWSNDDREIVIDYIDNLVSSVSANGRKWIYNHVKPTEGLYRNKFFLERVTLPDGRHWSFGSSNQRTGISPVVTTGTDCAVFKQEGSYALITHMRHPSGTRAEFHTNIINNVKINVPGQSRTYGSINGGSANTNQFSCITGSLAPRTFMTRALMSKKIILSDGQTSVWTYDYSKN